MRILKVLMIPAALAVAPAASMAATTPPGAPERVTTGVETTPVYHRGYWHDRNYYYRPYRPHWRSHRYYYGPRCYWSRYWHRTICR